MQKAEQQMKKKEGNHEEEVALRMKFEGRINQLHTVNRKEKIEAELQATIAE